MSMTIKDDNDDDDNVDDADNDDNYDEDYVDDDDDDEDAGTVPLSGGTLHHVRDHRETLLKLSVEFVEK